MRRTRSSKPPGRPRPAPAGPPARPSAGSPAGSPAGPPKPPPAVPPASPAARPAFDRRGLTVAAFLAHQRAGGLLEGPWAELLGGTVSAPAALGPVEAAAIARLERALQAAAGPVGGRVERRAALRLGPGDLLRADLAVLSSPATAVALGGSHDPRDSLVVVEVMRGRSSHERRAPLYAAAGARELWLLDVRRGWTEVLRSPWRGLYRSRTLWYPGEAVPLAQLGGVGVEAMPHP